MPRKEPEVICEASLEYYVEKYSLLRRAQAKMSAVKRKFSKEIFSEARDKLNIRRHYCNTVRGTFQKLHSGGRWGES